MSRGSQIMWQVLFAPGHDVCRVTETDGAILMEGGAVFAESGNAVNLQYRVECGPDWSSQRAFVTGWIGVRNVDVAMRRQPDGWYIRGVPTSDIDDLSDVDLGFTPATNTLAIRRLRLSVGEMAETTALWLDVDNWCVKPLRQTYRRLDHDRYEYTSPDHDYQAVLTIDERGFVTDYPNLWIASPLA